jgi:hypothetical protein
MGDLYEEHARQKPELCEKELYSMSVSCCVYSFSETELMLAWANVALDFRA